MSSNQSKEGNCELQASKNPSKRLRISGNKFGIKEINTSRIKLIGDQEYYVFEGDIIIDSIENFNTRLKKQQRKKANKGVPERAVVVTTTGRRWPNNTIPYEIDSNLGNRARVTGAIDHWKQETDFKFVPRTSSHSDYVVFVPGQGCSSYVGRRRGSQNITLSDRCTKGNVTHEIGHAIGLWHEQSAERRDESVQIIWENIDPDSLHNFDQHITDGDDIGNYDYCSIMHYPRTAFSVNGKDTIVPLYPIFGDCYDIGQRIGLSEGDIAAVNNVIIR